MKNAKELLKGLNKKVIAIGLGVVLVCGIGGVFVVNSQTGFLLSEKSKKIKITDSIKAKEYDKAKELTDKFCPEGTGKRELLSAIDLCEKYNVNDTQVAKQKKYDEDLETKKREVKRQQLEEYTKFCGNIKVTDSYVEETGGNYFNACVVIENNNSRPISYIQFDVFIYDESGNLVNTAMANETNIPANSKRIVKKMLPCGDGSWTMKVNKVTMG